MDIDVILATLRERHPQLRISQLTVKFPADDDGLWFIKNESNGIDIQLESSTYDCPFLLESNVNRFDKLPEIATVIAVAEKELGLI